MIEINPKLRPQDLSSKIDRLWALSAEKLHALEKTWNTAQGAPVFTVQGQYTSRGWTEWTQGFQYGSAILQYDATEDESFLATGRRHTLQTMTPHLTHMGVHDHGFNNVSTYGNLWRLIVEGRLSHAGYEKEFYELALKCSGAVQARRWTRIHDGRGFIYSFNGPHSLFSDTIRSLRALALAHDLGHELLEEKDTRVPLLLRLGQHAQVTAEYNVYYGGGRDAYDLHGRVAHESIFNVNDGRYRCPNSQQGYSPFTTWTRGLAWIMLGYAEQLEYIDALPDTSLEAIGGRQTIEDTMRRAASATCDFYIHHSPSDGIPYWDTGAPNLYKLGDYLKQPAEPFNPYEPVDSSAAAIASQGLLRLGHYLRSKDESLAGDRYWQAGLTVVDRLLTEPYLSVDSSHQGLILHSIYHRPNGWDYIPAGATSPCGESSMWGDYHAREVALYLRRILRGEKYYTFFAR